MAPRHAPERRATQTKKARRSGAKNRCDIHGLSAKSHRVTKSIAVTAGQLAIVEAARAWRRKFGVWPNAGELATAAEFARPDVWLALKVLVRLGVVRWRRLVEVVRQPDGIFFVPTPRNLSRDAGPAPSTLWFPVQGATP